MSYRLGVDVGGTFTDFLLFDEANKTMTMAKVPTTSANQAVGILQGLERITQQRGINPHEITLFVHGTTTATNAILEGKGAKTALVVTEGFRDVLHIMRQDRPRLYDFFARRPPALVPRHRRFEIAERILYSGEIQNKLEENELQQVVAQIQKAQVDAVAVCLLHSYANPIHERQIEEALNKQCPGLSVSISSAILPEIREYERMSTTAMNACVVPILDKYLKDLQERLSRIGIGKTVYIMQSNGGLVPSVQARRQSVSSMLSGPAAGVLGGVALAEQAGFKNLITVDMGGTSFDICLVHEGKPKFSRATEVGGHALNIPMIDIHSIGAGGGSIAWIDPGGALKVGPRSAGADPGPVCYGRGGTEPTVTDANLVLNRLNPDYFLGGEMKVDEKAARKAIEVNFARRLGMKVLAVAEGLIGVVNANMARGIRFVSVEKGYDPREFAMVCFGGNGPLHGVELAEELGIPKVVVPFAPGVNCAYGLLRADFRHDYVRSCVKQVSEVRFGDINALYAEMEKLARARMKEAEISAPNVVITRSLDMRYYGQGYELVVPVDSGRITGRDLKAVEDRFHALHKKNYGFSRRTEPTEIVNLRITSLGLLAKPELRKEPLDSPNPRQAPKERRRVFLRGKYHLTAVYDREELRPGTSVSGPAIIEQKDSTTLLFPRNSARIDAYRNIIISVKGGI